jgi:hypothetical protein
LKKKKEYDNVRFVTEAVLGAHHEMAEIFKSHDCKPNFLLGADRDGEHWTYDSFEEFVSDFEKSNSASYVAWVDKHELSFARYETYSVVSVKSPSREEIQRIFNLFEKHLSISQIPPRPQKPRKIRVFIGHGHNDQWRDLKDHLHEKHGYEVEAYEIGARSGHTIRDVLEEMLDRSSFALLVLTGEDATLDNRVLARQNVIHETGLFQGRLGFSKAIVLLEDGTEEFSNIAGIQQIRYSKGNIKECFGDVLATLRREFMTS